MGSFVAAPICPLRVEVASGLERVGAPRMDETPAGRVVPARPATLTPPGDRETMLQQAAGAVRRGCRARECVAARLGDLPESSQSARQGSLCSSAYHRI